MSTDTITVDWKWTDYQAEVRDALEAGDHDLVVFRTGYGGGKSITGAQWVHRGALQLDQGESLLMGQDFQKAKGTTFKVYWETLPGENTVPDDAGGDPENSPIVAGYNANENRVTYITGHKVRLGSADKWNRYAGGSSIASGATRSATTTTPTSTVCTRCSSPASGRRPARTRLSGRRPGMGTTSSTTSPSAR
jgi:hypothetical protein